MISAGAVALVVAVIEIVAFVARGFVTRGSVIRGSAGVAVLVVVGALVGGELGYTLIAASPASGWWQPWTVVGAVVGSAVALLVQRSWSPFAATHRPGPAPPGSTPPEPRDGPLINALVLLLVLVAVRNRWNSPTPRRPGDAALTVR